jgi:hypothetical protein
MASVLAWLLEVDVQSFRVVAPKVAPVSLLSFPCLM